jgi:TetR/AcrR family transcriptional regulator, cholesterol catabolism regulator
VGEEIDANPEGAHLIDGLVDVDNPARLMKAERSDQATDTGADNGNRSIDIGHRVFTARLWHAASTRSMLVVSCCGTMTERITKSARTRQRILDAAARIFREQGYSEARLSDIADAVDMKTEILHLGIQKAWAHVAAALDALPPDATPLRRLEEAVRAHTMAVLELSDYTSAQARIVGQVPADIAKAHRIDQRAYGGYWHDLFQAARDAGQIRPEVDLFAARMLAFGAMNWTSEWFSTVRGADAAAVAEQAVGLVLYGLEMPR